MGAHLHGHSGRVPLLANFAKSGPSSASAPSQPPAMLASAMAGVPQSRLHVPRVVPPPSRGSMPMPLASMPMPLQGVVVLPRAPMHQPSATSSAFSAGFLAGCGSAADGPMQPASPPPSAVAGPTQPSWPPPTATRPPTGPPPYLAPSAAEGAFVAPTLKAAPEVPWYVLAPPPWVAPWHFAATVISTSPRPRAYLARGSVAEVSLCMYDAYCVNLPSYNLQYVYVSK